jgi:hypothetical protein
MKHFIIILIIVLGFNKLSLSQTEKLIPEALAIKTAYNKLQDHPDSAELQKKYIDLFPDNSTVFRNVFQTLNFDQLYNNSNLYIYKLRDIWDRQPDLIGYKLIRLCIGFKSWEADAIGYIQDLTVEYANAHIRIFITKVNHLSNDDQNALITFLADVENHSDYKSYQSLIDNLKKNDQTDLAVKFEKARELRKSKNDHGF